MPTSIYTFLSLGLLLLPTTLASPQATPGTNCDIVKVVLVKSGDSMSAISDTEGVKLAQTIFVNPQIKNPRLIVPGDKINIPNKACVAPETAPLPEPTAVCSNGTAKVYEVVSGDTLTIIAKEKLGITLQSLLAVNTQIVDIDRIQVGQKINIPICGPDGKPLPVAPGAPGGGNSTDPAPGKGPGKGNKPPPKKAKEDAPKEDAPAPPKVKRVRRTRQLY